VQPTPKLRRTRLRAPARLVSAAALGALFVAGPLAPSAHAEAAHPPLASARNFSVLGGSAVTNTGVTTIAQDIGVSSGTSLPATTGVDRVVVGGPNPPQSGSTSLAGQGQDDLTGAYVNAHDQIPRIPQDTELGGETKLGGIYNVLTTADMGLTGVLTLDGANNPDSIWVFQAGRDLNVAGSASIVLIRGANPCNVYWQVSRTATLGTDSRMIGTIMAETSVVMQTRATLQGRLLARSAEITLDTNVITNPACRPVGLEEDTPTPTPTPTPGDTGGTGGTNGGGGGGNGGTGGGNGTEGGTGGGSQITTVPTGSVDTGYVGSATATSETSGPAFFGAMLMLGFGGLALVALRRRRVR
jgi:hypothetical protein